jgi:hypothetical protein
VLFVLRRNGDDAVAYSRLLRLITLTGQGRRNCYENLSIIL